MRWAPSCRQHLRMSQSGGAPPMMLARLLTLVLARCSQCFSESCWAQLTKPHTRCLDLGAYTGQYDVSTPLHGTVSMSETYERIIEECTAGSRRPPVLPDEFARELAAKAFTNGKADRPLVARLYRTAFETQMCTATLSYQRLGWGDAEMATLAAVIESGALRASSLLNLSANHIGDQGVEALSRALAHADAAPKLATLSLEGNGALGDDGVHAMCRAIASGGLPALKQLELNGNRIGDAGMQGLVQLLRTDAAPKLDLIFVRNNPASEASQQEVEDALVARRRVEETQPSSPATRAMQALEDLMAMGFEKGASEAALADCDGDTGAALELLLGGSGGSAIEAV
jgi:hypothetical protein